MFKYLNFWAFLWDLKEFLGIRLGKFAPILFGLAIGAKNWKKIEKEEKDV